MLKILRNSPEGLPWKDYRIFSLILMAPISFLATLYLELVARIPSRRVDIEGHESIPRNAIIVGYHYDVMTNYLMVTHVVSHPSKLYWVGYHGLLAYLAFFCGCTGRYRNIRYQLKKGARSSDEVSTLLKRFPEKWFGIFTDAGGPYKRIRKGVVWLSRNSKRPVVPYRCFTKSRVLILGHQVPLPGTEVTIRFGKPIHVEELESIDEEAARVLIQDRIDRLEDRHTQDTQV